MPRKTNWATLANIQLNKMKKNRQTRPYTTSAPPPIPNSEEAFEWHRQSLFSTDLLPQQSDIVDWYVQQQQEYFNEVRNYNCGIQQSTVDSDSYSSVTSASDVSKENQDARSAEDEAKNETRQEDVLSFPPRAAGISEVIEDSEESGEDCPVGVLAEAISNENLSSSGSCDLSFFDGVAGQPESSRLLVMEAGISENRILQNGDENLQQGNEAGSRILVDLYLSSESGDEADIGEAMEVEENRMDTPAPTAAVGLGLQQFENQNEEVIQENEKLEDELGEGHMHILENVSSASEDDLGDEDESELGEEFQTDLPAAFTARPENSDLQKRNVRRMASPEEEDDCNVCLNKEIPCLQDNLYGTESESEDEYNQNGLTEPQDAANDKETNDDTETTEINSTKVSPVSVVNAYVYDEMAEDVELDYEGDYDDGDGDILDLNCSGDI